MSDYGISKRVNLSYEEAVEAIKASLKEEGFGVLTEIDVKKTLKAKLDVDFRKYIILGACNPPIAHQALQTEIELGLLLPCNVIVYEDDDGKTVISAIDPIAALGVANNPKLQDAADLVHEKLSRAVEAVG